MFANKLVVRNVLIECANQVVTIKPGAFDFVVPVVAESLGEAHDVHPVAGPTFAEMRGRQGAINKSLISPGRRVAHEEINFGGRGRKSGEHQAQPAGEGLAVGRVRGVASRASEG